MTVRRAALPERGSASVMAVGVIAAIVIAAGMSLTLGSALVARHRVAGVADSAALAAADAVRGLVAGYPCDRAVLVVAAQALLMTGCRIDGFVVEVEVSGEWHGLGIAVRARAGPPGGSD